MAVNSRNGWGYVSSLVGVAKTVAGVNVVQPNVGVGATIQAAGRIRLSKLLWRIDLAPDVPAGTVAAPTQFRVVVLNGANLPPDVSAWQQSAFGSAASHPEIPATSPLEVLYDEWLDVSAGDPGLNQPAFFDFADAGPSVDGSATMIVLLVPMITPMSQAIVPANGTLANAQLTLAVFGRGDSANPLGGAGAGAGHGASLPRYDVPAP